jgi:hypothetical protein
MGSITKSLLFTLILFSKLILFTFLLVYIVLLFHFIQWYVHQEPEPEPVVYTEERWYNKRFSNGGFLKRTQREEHYTNSSWEDRLVYYNSQAKYIPPNEEVPESIRGVKNNNGIKDAFRINDLIIIPNSNLEFVIRGADNRWRTVSVQKQIHHKLQEIDYFYKEHGNKLSEAKRIVDENLELSLNYSSSLFVGSFRFRLAQNGRAFELVEMTSMPKEKEFVSRKRQAEKDFDLKIPSAWIVTKFFDGEPPSFALINLEDPNPERHIIRLIDGDKGYCRSLIEELEEPILLKIDKEPFLLEQIKSVSDTQKLSYENNLNLTEMVHGAIKIGKRNFYLCVYAERINNQIIEDFLTQLDSLNSPQ